MRRAAKVDANQADIVSALRKAGCRVQSLAAIGDGVPDLLVMRGFRLFLLEVKDPAQPPNKRQLKPMQKQWHAHWAGAPLAVVETAEQALRAVGP